MIQIVLDVSANTFKNDIVYFENMVQQIRTIDSRKYQITFKTQLFSKDSEAAKINIVLEHTIFYKMKCICEDYRYGLTSSIFDISSLVFLLDYINLPFIKIACRPDLYNLIESIPNNIPVYVSIDCRESGPSAFFHYQLANRTIRTLKCIPEYPAKTKDYIDNIFKTKEPIYSNISDHTTDLKLFNYWKSNLSYMGESGYNFPFKYEIFELHYVLEHDSNNPDAGAFAKTIKDLKEIL